MKYNEFPEQADNASNDIAEVIDKLEQLKLIHPDSYGLQLCDPIYGKPYPADGQIPQCVTMDPAAGRGLKLLESYKDVVTVTLLLCAHRGADDWRNAMQTKDFRHALYQSTIAAIEDTPETENGDKPGILDQPHAGRQSFLDAKLVDLQEHVLLPCQPPLQYDTELYQRLRQLWAMFEASSNDQHIDPQAHAAEQLVLNTIYQNARQPILLGMIGRLLNDNPHSKMLLDQARKSGEKVNTVAILGSWHEFSKVRLEKLGIETNVVLAPAPDQEFQQLSETYGAIHQRGMRTGRLSYEDLQNAAQL